MNSLESYSIHMVIEGMKWKNRYLDNCCHFITSSIRGFRPILQHSPLLEIFRSNVVFYNQKYDVSLVAYVIMPDHIHLIIHSVLGLNVERYCQNLLRDTSRKIIQHYHANGATDELEAFLVDPDGKYRIWKEHLRCLPLEWEDMARTRFNYVHANPIRKGLVAAMEDYYYSSYINYYTDATPFLEVNKSILVL